MNADEVKCLKKLAEHFYDEGNYLYFRAFKGLPLKKVRRAVRSLARKGLAVYGRGLWNDDGPAGSGYACTEKGYEEINPTDFAKEKGKRLDL